MANLKNEFPNSGEGTYIDNQTVELDLGDRYSATMHLDDDYEIWTVSIDYN